jgi:hypothetical protein
MMDAVKNLATIQHLDIASTHIDRASNALDELSMPDEVLPLRKALAEAQQLLRQVAARTEFERVKQSLRSVVDSQVLGEVIYRESTNKYSGEGEKTYYEPPVNAGARFVDSLLSLRTPHISAHDIREMAKEAGLMPRSFNEFAWLPILLENQGIIELCTGRGRTWSHGIDEFSSYRLNEKWDQNNQIERTADCRSF